MNFARWMKPLMPLLLGLVLLVTACSSAPSKYDQVQQETTSAGATAVDDQALKGSTFNQFFPASDGAYEVVPSQEKQGFAEYKLKQDGKTVAMLSINDTASLPAAAAKYANTSDTLAGYPAVQQGATGTGILVNGRYQVKVLSRDDAFTPEDRAAWIEKFDLSGLSQLEASLQNNRPQAQRSPKLPANQATSPQAPAPGLVPQPSA